MICETVARGRSLQVSVVELKICGTFSHLQRRQPRPKLCQKRIPGILRAPEEWQVTEEVGRLTGRVLFGAALKWGRGVGRLVQKTPKTARGQGE